MFGEREVMIFNYKESQCPGCGEMRKRHSKKVNTVWDFGGKIKILFSYHWCRECKRYFKPKQALAVAGIKRQHTRQVILEALRRYRENKKSLERTCLDMKSDWRVEISPQTLHDWVRERRIEIEMEEAKA